VGSTKENKMSEKQPSIVFTGNTVRVSIVHSPVHMAVDDTGMGACIPPSPEFPANTYESKLMIEKLAGVDVYGNRSWVVVKDPHPQLLELAEELRQR
jgi:hypothetical protein